MLEHIPAPWSMVGIGKPQNNLFNMGTRGVPGIESVMKRWELKRRPFDGGPRMESFLGPGNTVLSLIGYITVIISLAIYIYVINNGRLLSFFD